MSEPEAYYQRDDLGFQLFSTADVPAWRPPQLAALGAILSQWSLAGSDRPLVSVPTGVGKTAIALAAPFLASAQRVLVVVPTKELRRQMTAQFKSQGVLRAIGALPESTVDRPRVMEASGRSPDWDELRTVDVVVGIPASISPAHSGDSPPPDDLFDFVIVDEAHHAPAVTWLAILEHYQARSLLLTATPHRRDRKRIPGALVYYYPLRQALDEGLYQPVTPQVVDVPDGATKEQIDHAVATEVVAVLKRPEHASSQFLVRASTKARAEQLAQLYSDLGHEVPVLHSGFGQRRQKEIVEDLRTGDHRGVAMVGMLVEGFDLPSLRVAAYHDKHKSLEPTAQLVGRLARVDRKFPQRSVLVTARDIDVYPHLEGAVRELYLEDRDWAVVLPGIVDGFVEEDLKNTEYARSFDEPTGDIDPAHIFPLRRAKIMEVEPSLGWAPSFHDGSLPQELAVGERFAGQRVLYAGTNPKHSTLLVVTGERVRPRWNSSEQLDSMDYDLHVVSFRQAGQTEQPDLLLINSKRNSAQTDLIRVIEAESVARPADPSRVQEAFDSLERLSVSSVGVRSTYGATRGTPSYKMFAGSAIESGIRDSDTAQASLGHAMVQVAGDGGAFTAGVSTGKSKYWETRYTPLRLYESFVTELAERYWYPSVPPSGPLLPHIHRGSTLTTWPDSDVLAVTLDHALIGAEWTIDGAGL
ncbi:MAG: DEAD/DEAH box helicase family protein [Thermoleophilia bacterium]